MRASARRPLLLTLTALFFLTSGRSIFNNLEPQDQFHYPNHENLQRSGRHLLAEHFHDNCTPRALTEFPSDILPYAERRHGAVVLHIIIALYAFGALAVICDDYFVSSLEIICDVLNLQEDVAGSTFMAIGSSAPELFTSLIGLFFAKSDVGVGAIVGSAVFNLLFTIGLCGLCGGMVIYLKWWPIMRDCVCYMVALTCLLLIMFDQVVHWYEATIMLILYVLYIILMGFNQKVSNYLVPKLSCCQNRTIQNVFKDKFENSPLIKSTEGAGKRYDTPSYEKQNGEMLSASGNFIKDTKKKGVGLEIDLQESIRFEDSEFESAMTFPSSCLGRCFYVVMLPMKIVFHFTVPDCKRPGCWRKLYILTFLMCIAWIAVMSYIIVWMVTVIGDTWDIPDTVMGVTLLAIGSSIPDSLNSLLVARQGLGEMAVSNPIGSNIFDIMFGLGFPWFLKTVAIDNGSVVYINSTGLVMGIAVLAISVIYLLLLTAINGWKVNKKFAIFSLLGYVFVTIILCLFELNVFGYFNPPTCARSVG